LEKSATWRGAVGWRRASRLRLEEVDHELAAVMMVVHELGLHV
jgi:hypothetical protein